jgi:hypothetical protein
MEEEEEYGYDWQERRADMAEEGEYRRGEQETRHLIAESYGW